MPVAGPFYFAWTSGPVAYSSAHHVMAEYIFKADLVHEEGKAPTLTLVIKNPKIGLANPSRARWCWFSRFNGSSFVPLFRGKLVAVPSDIFADKVEIVFTAHPDDYVAQQAAVAATLKVRPFYDPIFIKPEMRADPTTVLEGYSKLWHIDRTTNVVSVSDIINAEDGTVAFSADDALYNSVQMKIGTAPKTAVTVSSSVTWTQGFSGSIKMGTKNFKSYGDGIANGWPKSGTKLSGGWEVLDASAEGGEHKPVMVTLTSSYQNSQKKHGDGDLMSVNESWTFPDTGAAGGVEISREGSITVGNPDRPAEFGADATTGNSAEASIKITTAYIHLFNVRANLTLGYTVKQGRKENVSFTLNSDLQPIMTAPEDGLPETITLDGPDVGVALEDNSVPIGASVADSYFQQERGHRSLEYLICVARAKLLNSARCVTVTFDTYYDRLLTMSCRKSVTLSDPRLPGGVAAGKVSAYSLAAEGSSGTIRGSVTMLCAIGTASVISASVGTPEWADDDYVDPDYQVHTGKTALLPSVGDVQYSLPSGAPQGPAGRLSKRDLIVSETIGDGAAHELAVTSQLRAIASRAAPSTENGNALPSTIAAAIIAQQVASGRLEQVVKETAPDYELELKPVDGVDVVENAYVISLSRLSVPKQVDLSAPQT